MATDLRLCRFRVQNYKSVEDSDWIDVDPAVTALVGKNEAGKSGLLRALYKLNPVDKEKFVPVREFPRGRYTYEFERQDWPVISAEFAIPQNLQDQIAAKVHEDWHPQSVTITKRYSGQLHFSFSPAFPGTPLTGTTLVQWLGDASKKIQRVIDKEHTEELQTLKASLGEAISGWRVQVQQGEESLRMEGGRTLLQQISQGLSSALTDEWIRPIVEPLMNEIDVFVEWAQRGDPAQEAWAIVKDHQPVFIYFEDYGTLDDTLVIDRFIADHAADPHDSKLRTKMALFRHVNLQPEEVVRLGLEHNNEAEAVIRDRKDERAIKLDSASRAMTAKFQGWWGQRRHEFQYQVDGNYFRIWVSDDKNPDRIELTSRSRGLQWFFSFYLIFLVEAADGHRNAILLLDEPGLHLHPTAQQDLLTFFENLSSHNQVLYSTHSPFMIDGAHLDRVKVVTETEAGQTAVSDRIWPKDREATFPLQAALGYSLAQSLFQGKRSLVVEGLTDLWILKAMDAALAELRRTHLYPDVVITPAGGAKEVAHFASLFLANDVEIVTLFDSDQTGRRYADTLTKGLMEGDASGLVLVTTADGRTEIEVEDLIPRVDYLGAVAAAHRDLLDDHATIDLTSEEDAKSKILDALEAYAQREKLVSQTGTRTVFDKGLTARQLLDTWQKSAPKKLDKALLNNFEYLFAAVNAAFDKVRS